MYTTKPISTSNYQRRWGFYILVLAIIWSLYDLVRMARLNTEIDFKQLTESSSSLSNLFGGLDGESKQAIESALAGKVNCSFRKWVGAITSVAAGLVYLALICKPKLTMEKGNFKKVLLAFSAISLVHAIDSAIFQYINSEVFLAVAEQLSIASAKLEYHSKNRMLLKIVILLWSYTPSKIAIFTAFILIVGISICFMKASILTMDEDYKGGFSCLKYLKPYKNRDITEF